MPHPRKRSRSVSSYSSDSVSSISTSRSRSRSPPRRRLSAREDPRTPPQWRRGSYSRRSRLPGSDNNDRYDVHSRPIVRRKGDQQYRQRSPSTERRRRLRSRSLTPRARSPSRNRRNNAKRTAPSRRSRSPKQTGDRTRESGQVQNVHVLEATLARQRSLSPYSRRLALTQSRG